MNQSEVVKTKRLITDVGRAIDMQYPGHSEMKNEIFRKLTEVYNTIADAYANSQRVDNQPSKHPLPVGTKVRIRSDHFKAECDAVIEEVVADHAPLTQSPKDPGHFVYRVEVVAGEVPRMAMTTLGEIWVNDFEVTKREEAPCTPLTK